MTTVELTIRDVGSVSLQQWLHAHGLNPNDTAVGLTVTDGYIHAERYLRDEHGKLIADCDPMSGDLIGPRKEQLRLRLLHPLPAGLGTVTEP